MRRSLSSSALPPSSAPTGRRLLPVPGESRAVVQGAGLTRRQGPHARLEGGAGAQIVHHRVPPGRTDAAAWGAGRVNPRPEQAERRPGAHVLPAGLPARKAANLTTVRLAGQEGPSDAHQ